MAKVKGSRIAGVGSFIPSTRMNNDSVLNLLKNHSAAYLGEEIMNEILQESKDKLKKVGSKTRYWCREHEYCTDIAFKASVKALKNAKIKAEELDFIIFTGMSKAFVEPATAHVLRHNLQALNANVMDTQDACTSFIKSIELADALIKNGTHKKILIAAGERSFDWADFQVKTKDELAWKFASLTIGDGAGAIVLEATDDEAYTKNPYHNKFFYKIYSEHFSACTIGLNYSVGERYRLFSHSKKLIRAGYKATSDLVKEIYNDKIWKNFKYDSLILHNVGNIVDSLIKQILEESNAYTPDKHKPFFPKYGNVGSASLPVAMVELEKEGRLKRGDMAMVIVPAAGVQCGIMTFRY